MNFGSLSGLGSLMRDVLKAADVDTRLKEQTCLLVWDEVVGEQVAKTAQPDFVRDGVLFVVTKSAVWSNELTFYKRDMLSNLNRRVGGTVLKDIVFKVGRVSYKKKKALPAGDDRPDLEGIKLDDDELKQIETIALNAGVENAESFKKVMVTSFKLEKWKRSHGWTPCRKCGALQKSASGVCPVCEWPG